MITFFAKGTPKPMPRPRVFMDRGKMRAVNPTSAEGWKALVTFVANGSVLEHPLEGPLSVTLEFLFPRPDSHFRKVKPNAEQRAVGTNLILIKRGMAPDWVVEKPLGDIDNLAKAVLDALTRCQMWNDDCQVAVLTTSKKYCEEPDGGCLVKIEEL